MSSSGFQSGAVTVAKNHGIDLFVLNKVIKAPNEFKKALKIPVFFICDFYLIEISKRLLSFPKEDNVARFWAERTIIKTGAKFRPLCEVLKNTFSSCLKRASEEFQEEVFNFEDGSKASLENFFTDIDVTGVKFKFRIQNAYLINEPCVDPALLYGINSEFKYKNYLSGEEIPFHPKDVGKFLCPTPRPGSFYKDSILGFNFYVDSLENDLLTIYLVESYQHGSLIQGVFQQETKHNKTFVEITDKKEIWRLEKMLRKMKSRK